MSIKSIQGSIASLLPLGAVAAPQAAKPNEFHVPGTNTTLLKDAVLLIPCAHSMQEKAAEERFGPMKGEVQGKSCPECDKPVTGFLPDHKMRNLYQSVPKTLGADQEASSLQERNSGIVNLRKELQCPVNLEPQTEGVALIPCAHRVNQASAEAMYGKMNGEFCEKQLQKCPECRTIVSGYIPDPAIRELSRVLPQRLSDLEYALTPLSERISGFFRGLPDAARPVLQRVSAAIQEAIYGSELDRLIDLYASLPIETITPVSFVHKVQELKTAFPQKEIENIEATLRQALKARFNDAFSAVAFEYLRNIGNTKIPVLKAQLFIRFAAEKAAIEAEIVRIGPIDASYYDNPVDRLIELSDRFASVNAKLEVNFLTARARSEANAIGQFYAELNESVTAENKLERHDALHEILG
jgi:hypothetical protein